jgi:hypothetical protein
MLSKPSLKIGLANYQALNTADRSHIARWRDRAQDDLWETIQRAIPHDRPAIESAEFIKTVLAARRSAIASVNRVFGFPGSKKIKPVPGFNEEWAYVLAALKKRLSKLPTRLGPIEVATILEEVAQDVRDLHRFRFGFADHLGLPARKKFELSQKSKHERQRPQGAGYGRRHLPGPALAAQTDRKGLRAKKLFMQIVHDYLHLHCNRYLDSVVASLTAIAFDCDCTIDQAKSAHQATTKAERAKK